MSAFFEVVAEGRATLAEDDRLSLVLVPVPPSLFTVDREPRPGDLVVVKTSEAIAYPLQQKGIPTGPYGGHGFAAGTVVEVVRDEVGGPWDVLARGDDGETWYLNRAEFDILA